jgi:hypothetical protein
MSEARVVFHTRNARYSSGNVHSILLIRVDDVEFPDAEWDDFAVVLLSWWCQAVVSLLRHEVVATHLSFMDGPYQAELERVFRGGWKILLVQRRQKPIVSYEARIEIASFVRSILDATDQALALCREREWWNEDADKLTEAADILRNTPLPQQ